MRMFRQRGNFQAVSASTASDATSATASVIGLEGDLRSHPHDGRRKLGIGDDSGALDLFDEVFGELRSARQRAVGETEQLVALDVADEDLGLPDRGCLNVHFVTCEMGRCATWGSTGALKAQPWSVVGQDRL